VVFETLSSILYAAVADEKLPSTNEIVSILIIVVGVVLGVRATYQPCGEVRNTVPTVNRTPADERPDAQPEVVFAPKDL
jgi:hypothetical protein